MAHYGRGILRYKVMRTELFRLVWLMIINQPHSSLIYSKTIRRVCGAIVW